MSEWRFYSPTGSEFGGNTLLAKGKAHPERDGPLKNGDRLGLNAEGGAATAGRLDLRVLKLETGRFEGLNVVNNAAVEIHQ